MTILKLAYKGLDSIKKIEGEGQPKYVGGESRVEKRRKKHNHTCGTPKDFSRTPL